MLTVLFIFVQHMSFNSMQYVVGVRLCELLLFRYSLLTCTMQVECISEWRVIRHNLLQKHFVDVDNARIRIILQNINWFVLRHE